MTDLYYLQKGDSEVFPTYCSNGEFGMISFIKLCYDFPDNVHVVNLLKDNVENYREFKDDIYVFRNCSVYQKITIDTVNPVRLNTVISILVNKGKFLSCNKHLSLKRSFR